MRPGITIAYNEDGSTTITLCVAQTNTHGRIDQKFEFRASESKRAYDFQEMLCDTYKGSVEQPIVMK